MTTLKWLTPNAAGDSNISRCLIVPISYQKYVNGALDLLAAPWNWEQSGDLSPDEIADIFRGLLDNYYNSEDCAMAGIPDRYFGVWIEGVVIAGNALAASLDTRHILNTVWAQSAPAINDIVEFQMMLQDGVYDLTQCGLKHLSGGIQHWLIDTVEDGQTIDKYSAADVFNQVNTISVNILTSGPHIIQCKMSSKNGASTNYWNNVTWLKLVRTGGL